MCWTGATVQSEDGVVRERLRCMLCELAEVGSPVAGTALAA